MLKLQQAQRGILPALAGVLAVSLAVSQAANHAFAADQTVAIVEDVSSSVTDVQPMELLRTGRQIRLGESDTVIISYFSSCQRESIQGGEIVVGTTQSDIKGGNIARKRVACDASALALSPEQANQSATMVFRKPDNVTSGDPVAAEAKFVMSTRLPLVFAPDLDSMTVEDLRHPGRHWSVKFRKGVADITAGREPLERGGVYRLVAGERSLAFRIGKEATDAPLPLLQRAIRFVDQK